jgi:hypothetical protein
MYQVYRFQDIQPENGLTNELRKSNITKSSVDGKYEFYNYGGPIGILLATKEEGCLISLGKWSILFIVTNVIFQKLVLELLKRFKVYC